MKINQNNPIIYNRTSKTEQNPENQLKDCSSINSYGEPLILQEQQSAWKDNIDKREVFQQVISLIKEGQVKHLIVWDLDRLYRNRLRLKEFFQLCKAYDCKIHSYRQNWLEEINKIPSPWNEIVFEMLLNIFGWIAEDESSKRSERIKAAIRKDGSTTLSYKGNRWGRKSIISKVLPEVIQLHESGLNVREIAQSVFYFDKNNNKRNISIGLVHKILQRMMNTTT